MDFKSVLKENILVLDGAIGTMIQKYNFREEDFRGREFLLHSHPMKGFNDILNISKPSSIIKIHREYIKAGANIITTNTFNSNSISMADYGLDKIEGLARKLNKEGALLAKKAVEEFKESEKNHMLFIAGSIGPTNRSATLSPDITDPLKRNVTYDELFKAYEEQVRGLLEGGIDIMICETFFDTLNLKAALGAANKIMNETGLILPIMVSATVSDNAGRILSGQTLKAFVTSVMDFENIAVIGLNCGFGPDRMKKYIKEIREINPYFTSCHPNAGLPDETGCYNVTSKDFTISIKKLLEDKLLNIVGGCCGTTPEFIKELSEEVKKFKPGIPLKNNENLKLSGLNMLDIANQFITVGERCNVAGSAKFLRLIKEKSFDEASEIAKKEIEMGASIIDINMDDALLDSKKEMVDFVRYLLAEPEVARVPFMIDSSKWDVITSALKNIQGKGIVNSLSLKDGEQVFIQKAKIIKDLGFALIVMAFDEKGQADTYERKIEICERAYNILIKKCGYHPEDIIFDVNIMTIATGMKEHARYAIDFMRAVSWIKKNLPGARTSGGVSNLSFSFRGKNKIREYMHVIFLYHAKNAGLDMAIINPSQNTKYDEIPLDIKNLIEDIIFDNDDTAVDRLIEIANQEAAKDLVKEKKENLPLPEPFIIEELLEKDLINGELKEIEAHIKVALEEIIDPVKIIEGPLLKGMKKVGDLFSEGKMFLPQVVKTARSMKKAVEILTPIIEASKSKTSEGKKAKILIATVKGDVHDIGKNIVSTVLSCNNYEVIDLGIMVPAEKIVETALTENPDLICLSGLITPSLGEMTETIKKLKEAGIRVPVMVGGAATSEIHTALKIDPHYDGIVLHMTDASQNPLAANELLNPERKEKYLKDIRLRYEAIRNDAGNHEALVSYEEILNIVNKERRNCFDSAKPNIELNTPKVINIPIKEIISIINWKMFFLAWKIQGKYLETFPYSIDLKKQNDWLIQLEEKDRNKAKEALELFGIAFQFLQELMNDPAYDGKGLINFLPAQGDIKNIYFGGKMFPMLRQQRKESDFLSCCDYVGDKGYIGLFAVTAGRHIINLSKKYKDQNDDFKSLILQTLADRIAEASAEWLQNFVSEQYWKIKIRPAWGYPMLPDQTLLLETLDFLPYNEIGITVTENGAMYPQASISGMYFSKKEAKYFMIGNIQEDQLKDYAERRGVSEDRIRQILRQI